MELRHQHKNERDVSAESDRKKDEPEIRPQWPGKKTLTGAPQVDARTPDLKRIRAAIGALRGSGAALPGAMTHEYSKLLGLDLSDVRLHRGGAAAAAARSLDATAFTHGTDIAIADHLDLDSAFGRHVIAHELVHVAQNKRSGGGGMDLAAHAEVGPSGSAVEQEAERGAAALTRGMSFVVGAHSRLPSISRFGNDENPPTGAASPVAVPGTNPPPVDAPVRAAVPTPGSQPTQAQPAVTPPPAPATPAATPAPQPRPTTQPAGSTPVAPAGTPGVNAPSGSGAAPNPTTPASREPRPAAAPRTTGSPTPAVSLDDRVKQELETRADPTLKAGYARAVAGVDALRVQALQFTFQPNGVWNTLVETFTAKNAFQDHFGQIYSTNAYRGGNSWADTAQSWIEGLRGVVHIIGDIASVVSAWAGLAALVTGALALILSETVIGGIALGAIAVIAAEVAMVAGAIKLLTDIIDTILGVIQMIILVVRARNSKDPAARARFASLLRKEAGDFGANVVSIGVQVAVMAVSAGIGAGLSRGANTFVSSFRSEFTRMITPALKPWTLGANVRGIANMMKPATAGSGVRGLQGRNLRGQQVPRTVLNAEVNAGLIGVNRQLRVGNRITAARETIPFTAANQMRGARLVLMRRALISNLLVNTGGFKIGFGAAQLQADIKQPRDFNRGGTSSSSPSANGGRLNVPQAAGSDLSKVQMWPSQIELFENAKGPIQGTTDRTQRQYEMAEAQAGPELSAQVRTAFQGATNSAGQMRFGAMAVQTDAQEGQANTQRGLQQTQQAGQQRDQMAVQQGRASTSVNRINNEGTKLQSPPPKEGVLGWLYNQTIGRIGGWIGSAQKWVVNLVGKWAMSLAGFSKEEMDIAGIENDMREDDKKDQNSSQEAQDAALRADQIQQTVFQLQENRTRDEQYAIQGMADAQRFIQALEDADRQLAAAITNGQAYIGQVSPMIAHELQTEEAEAAIDEAYIAPVAGGIVAFTNSIDGANVGDTARQQGVGELNAMKAAFPELDISQGTTAINTAVQTYTTAFGTLASSARTQAAAINTAVQAFIGTQDYDGVGANAAALEALAADFNRQATALETQLFQAVQSVVNQYVTHIINAVTQAQQLPDEPDDDSPPTDQPPVQRKALSNAPVISVQRKALTNATAPQQMQQTEAKVPTDINNPAPAAAPAPANAGDNANAPAPAGDAATTSANGAQVPGTAPNGATASNPKDGLVGGASNTTDAPATAAKAKPAGATPKQQANPAGADKAPIESENEAEASVASATAGTGAGSNGSDNASEPGATPDKPRTRADAGTSEAPDSTTAPTTMTATGSSFSTKSTEKKPVEKKQSNEKVAAVPSGANGVSDGAASMVSGSTIEDGWTEAEQRSANTDDKLDNNDEVPSGSSRSSSASSGSSASSSEASSGAAVDAEKSEEAGDEPGDEPLSASESESQDSSDDGDVDGAVQRRANGAAATSSPVSVAMQATAGSGGALPYLDTIQSAFGDHDVSSIRSHAGSAAEAGAAALNAKAFAVGDAVAFGASPDLHTAAHEAAHVVQQRAGLAPSGGIDSGSSDSLEQHADRVADAVVAGRSAQSILDQLVGGSSRGAATAGVSRKGAAPTVTSATTLTAEGAADTRTTVGVGETVKLTSSVAGTWTATAGTATGAENLEFEWTAPGKPGTSIVTVKTKDGEATKEFAVVGPSKVTFKKEGGTLSPGREDMMGAGMAVRMTLHAAGDHKVSFGNVTVREQEGGASNTSGYFARVGGSGAEDLRHYPAKNRDGSKTQNEVYAHNDVKQLDDATFMDVESKPWTRPFSVGSMTWQIPYLYSTSEAKDVAFTIATQTTSIIDSKVSVTITKGGASVTRTPKQPLWQPPPKPAKEKEAAKDEPKQDAEAAPKANQGELGASTASAGKSKKPGKTEAAANEIKHEVVDEAYYDSNPQRTLIGVGEQVRFKSAKKGTWVAAAAAPGTATTATGTKFLWTAPSTSQWVSITLEDGAGNKSSVGMTVTAPTSVDYFVRSEVSQFFDAAGNARPATAQGAGMILDISLMPFTVNFKNVQLLEQPGPASNPKGYFTSVPLPAHVPSTTWAGFNNLNGGPADRATFSGFPSPWAQGSFDWKVPNHFRVVGDTGAGTEFYTTTQTCTILDNIGTTTVTKGTALSQPRAPGVAAAAPAAAPTTPAATTPAAAPKAKGKGKGKGEIGSGEGNVGGKPTAGKPSDDPRRSDPYNKYQPKVVIDKFEPQVGKASTVTVRDTESERAAKALKNQAPAIYTWTLSGKSSMWTPFPTAKSAVPRATLEIESKTQGQTTLRVDLTRTSPTGVIATATGNLPVSILSKDGKAPPNYGASGQDPKQSPEAAAQALHAVTSFIRTGERSEIHPDYLHIYKAWESARTSDGQTYDRLDEEDKEVGKNAKNATTLAANKAAKEHVKKAKAALKTPGGKWLEAIEAANKHTGQLLTHASSTPEAADYKKVVKELTARAKELQEAEKRDQASTVAARSLEPSGFDELCEMAGALVEKLVDEPGKSAKLTLRANIPLSNPKFIFSPIFTLQLERDTQYKLRGDLAGALSFNVDARLVEAFVQGKVYGSYEASADDGAELFRFIKLAIVDKVYNYSKSTFGEKTAHKMAYGLFSKDQIDQTREDMDEDDYVESGGGVELSGAVASKSPLPGEAPKAGKGAGGKLELSSVRKIGSVGDQFAASDITKATVALSGSWGPGSLEGSLQFAEEIRNDNTADSGKAANKTTELAVSGGMQLALKDLTNETYIHGLIGGAFAMLAGVCEGIPNKEVPSIVDYLRRPVAITAVRLAPSITGKSVEGKVAGKLSIKLTWTNGKYTGGEAVLASSDAYSFGEETKAGGFVSIEFEEKLFTLKF